MKNLLFFLLAATLFFACGDANNTDSTDQAEAANEEMLPAIIDETISTQGTVALSQEELWAQISDFGAIANIFPGVISSSEANSNEVGASRTCILADGSGEIVEELTKLDMENQIIEYKVLSSPMPVENYSAMMQVGPGEEEGTSVLSWVATYQVPETVREEMKLTIQEMQQIGIANFNKLAMGEITSSVIRGPEE